MLLTALIISLVLNVVLALALVLLVRFTNKMIR